jgi:hypothetical protein
MSNALECASGPTGFGMKNGSTWPVDGGRIKQAVIGYGKQAYGQ